MTEVNKTKSSSASSQGRLVNSGNGPTLIPIDINHPEYVGLVDPDTAFWALVAKTSLADVLADSELAASYRQKSRQFAEEMFNLRFGLSLSAVYINVTERCNLNCSYCYIPEEMRRSGDNMKADQLLEALNRLRSYFREKLPKGRLPQIIFHGAEPLLCKDAIFKAIESFSQDFRFGIQTNGTVLDDAAARFLMHHGTGIGLSLDGHIEDIADLTRKTWAGESVYQKTLSAMEQLKNYPAFNVICTVTNKNVAHLNDMVEFFHLHEVPAVMVNMVRCTLPPARDLKPDDGHAALHFISALERTHELFKKTGRKLIVVNFANILLSILAPTARRLMCDISPCGGGRVFFALSPDGGMYPCSEFIGLSNFQGGNLFTDSIDEVLESAPFKVVTERQAENIEPCKHCAIRHFCGSPCPAEAFEMNGDMQKTGAFCEFYEEQVRYAFRLIADGKADDFLWNEWDKDTETVFDALEFGVK